MTQVVEQKKSQVLDEPVVEAAAAEQQLEKSNPPQLQPEAPTLEKIAAIDVADIKITAAAEAHPVEVPPAVVASGVQTHHEENEIKTIHENHPDQDVIPAGDHTPVYAATGEAVQLTPKPNDHIFPPVMQTGVYAKGDSEPLHKLFLRKVGQLLFGIKPKQQAPSTAPVKQPDLVKA